MKKGSRRKKTPEAYRERAYRRVVGSGMVSTFVRMMETDLHILASCPVEDPALLLVTETRRQLELYIAEHPLFLESLAPLPDDPQAPALIREMLSAGRLAGVGPMAAVAGVVAETVGRGLLAGDGVAEVIVENGGDIFLARQVASVVSVYAGESPLSGRVGLRIAAQRMPLGVCCSSGAIGHSLSLGQADAVVVIAPSTALADAAATRLGNEATGRRPVERALEVAREIEGISGVVVIVGEQLGAWGDIELVEPSIQA
ncbi:UPF0280 family protein [Desulfolithobacter sp.]